MRSEPVLCLLAAVFVGGVLIIGCREPKTTPPANSTPSEARSAPQAFGTSAELGDTAKPSSDRELDRQIKLYMFASSDYWGRCRSRNEDGNVLTHEDGNVLTDEDYDEYFDRRAAIGLIAGAYIQRVGEAAVPAVVEAWEQAESGDGIDEKWRLRELLQRLGPAGWKAVESPPISPIVGEHLHTPLSDDDSEWVKFFRREREGWCDELWWMLTRDREPLSRLEKIVDEQVQDLRDLSEGCYQSWFEEVDWDAHLMRDVLLISPVDGGVSDAKLRDWAQDSGSAGIRWAATLVLANRGNLHAEQHVHEIIRNRFPLSPKEEHKWDEDTGGEWEGACRAAMFLFVQELAKTGLIKRWDLLLELLADTDPKLLPPRAAVLLALDEHWEELPPQIAKRARQEITDLHLTEKNEWLQMLMMSVLAGHPQALDDY